MAPERATAARRAKPRATAGATSRLDLLEALLMSRDAGQCAQRALAWLQRQAGVRRALCLAADGRAAEAVLAENATLRAQLAASGDGRTRRRRPAGAKTP